MALVLENITKHDAVVFRFNGDKTIKKLYNDNKILIRPNIDGEYSKVIALSTLKELLYGLGISVICKPNNEYDMDVVVGAPDIVSVAKQHAKSNLPNLKPQSSSGR